MRNTDYIKAVNKIDTGIGDIFETFRECENIIEEVRNYRNDTELETIQTELTNIKESMFRIHDAADEIRKKSA